MDANHHPQLLTDGAHQMELGYKFRGTTDVAVVDKVAYRAEEYKVHELSSLCKPVSVQSGLLCAELFVLPSFLVNAAEWPSLAV